MFTTGRRGVNVDGLMPLERGADPNTTIGGTSITALDIAEQFRHSDVATLLISRGAKHGPPR